MATRILRALLSILSLVGGLFMVFGGAVFALVVPSLIRHPRISIYFLIPWAIPVMGIGLLYLSVKLSSMPDEK